MAREAGIAREAPHTGVCHGEVLLTRNLRYLLWHVAPREHITQALPIEGRRRGCRMRRRRLARTGRGVCGLKLNFMLHDLHFLEQFLWPDWIMGGAREGRQGGSFKEGH